MEKVTGKITRLLIRDTVVYADLVDRTGSRVETVTFRQSNGAEYDAWYDWRVGDVVAVKGDWKAKKTGQSGMLTNRHLAVRYIEGKYASGEEGQELLEEPPAAEKDAFGEKYGVAEEPFETPEEGLKRVEAERNHLLNEGHIDFHVWYFWGGRLDNMYIDADDDVSDDETACAYAMEWDKFVADNHLVFAV